MPKRPRASKGGNIAARHGEEPLRRSNPVLACAPGLLRRLVPRNDAPETSPRRRALSKLFLRAADSSGLAFRESDSGLFSLQRDDLWMKGPLSVDGVGAALRGFRKSHHFGFASSGRFKFKATQRRSDNFAYPASRLHHEFPRQGRDRMSLLEGTLDSRANPLAVVEDIAADHNWAFERSGEDEVTIVSKGDWTDYQLSFTWMSEIEALHLACAFDMKIPAARRSEVQRLIAAVNEQMWVGHFDIWTASGMIMYRQAIPLPEGMTASTAQCESMLVSAIHACERYYPAMQFVVWAGKTAEQAMSAAMFDTAGEA
jgi:hypothetical protein